MQQGPAQARPGEVEAVPAGKRTVESVSAADALMDALELAAHEVQRFQVLSAPRLAIVFKHAARQS